MPRVSTEMQVKLTARIMELIGGEGGRDSISHVQRELTSRYNPPSKRFKNISPGNGYDFEREDGEYEFIGSYFEDLLEALGFTLEKQFKPGTRILLRTYVTFQGTQEREAQS